jgi:hypothetical protein
MQGKPGAIGKTALRTINLNAMGKMRLDGAGKACLDAPEKVRETYKIFPNVPKYSKKFTHHGGTPLTFVYGRVDPGFFLVYNSEKSNLSPARGDRHAHGNP